MATASASLVIRHLRNLVGQGASDLSDRELVARFIAQRDEAAFAALVHRHGPIVWRVCKRELHDWHDAEDAFQATFLILSRKAASVRRQESVGSWLYGTAYRVALRARTAASRRRLRESRSMPRSPADPMADVTVREAQAILDEELTRLAEKYRAPVVLCCLEGATREEAARQLGWSPSLVRSRLEEGRERLRRRLTRRGLTLPAALSAALVAEGTSRAAAPAILIPTTIKAVLSTLAGQAVGHMVSANVAALVDAGSQSFSLVKLKMAGFLLLGFCVVAAGGVVFQRAATSNPPDVQQGDEAGPAGVTPKPPKKAQPETAAPQSPGTDRHGDSLPARAVARLGTVRFRSDSWVGPVQVVPGGKQLLGIGSRAVILWDAATGREVRRFEAAAERKVGGTTYSVQIESFAVSPDEKTLAAGTSDGSRLDCPILLFDLATGRQHGEWPAHRSNGFSANHALAFVTRSLLVSAGADSSVRVWDLTSKREARRLETPEVSYLSALVPSPDRKHVLGTGSNGKAGWWALWEVASGKAVRREAGLPGQFVKAALSPDGKTLAVSIGVGEIQKEGGYNEVRLYSAPDWKEQRRWRTHVGQFPQRNSVTFSPDGTRLATGGADQKARQWDTTTGRAVGPAIVPYQYANDVAYLDTKTLITFGSQQAVKLWDATRGTPKLDFVGSEGHLTAVAYSPDGRHVATGGGGGDSTVRVWESATGKQVAHLRSGMQDVTCVQFSPDGKLIASADSGGVARLWDWMAGREVRAFKGHQGWLHCVAFSSDGKQLATGDEAGVVRLWSVADGELVHALRGHTAHVTALVFTADGRTLISGSWDHSIRHWDLATAKEIFAVKGVQDPTGRLKAVGHTSCVTALALSPNGRRLVSGSYDHTICVWEVSNGQLCRVLKGQDRNVNSAVDALALSADGKRLAAAIEATGQNSSVHVWDVLTGKKIGSLPGHRGQVTKLAFSPDGRRLASCSVDTTALIWDVTGLGSIAQPPDARAMAALWDDLGAADPVASYDAVCRGAMAGDEAVAVLKSKLKPVAAVEQGKVAGWVRQLDSPVFKVRQRASQALADLGPGAEPILRKLTAATDSVEVKIRAEKILSQLAVGSGRLARAVEVLETIGTQDAKRLLATLAAGAADARLTRDAAEALKRLRK